MFNKSKSSSAISSFQIMLLSNSLKHMTRDTVMKLLERMAKYLLWADKRIWQIVSELSEDEYSKDLGKNIGSIKRRYVHLAEDYQEWYYDWIGNSSKELPDFSSMGRDELFQSIQQSINRFISMIESPPIESIEIDTDRGKITITFEEIFFHLVNHATYHRGQIVMALRMLDRDVQMTDYVPHRIQTV